MVVDELVRFSNFYGSNEELVLAGGGNTSAKEDGVMYIKGSGTSLSTITKDGFVKMNRAKLRDIFTKTYPDNDKEREALFLEDLSAAKEPGEESKRPSVETTLHSLFEYTFVLHLHPALVNGLTCSQNGKEKARELFGDSVIWVDVCKPGYVLSKICFDLMEEYKKKMGKSADMILLENHGVFVAGNTVEELGEKLGLITSKIRNEIKREPDLSSGEFDGDKSMSTFNVLNDTFSDESVITYDPSVESLNVAKSKDTVEKIYKPFNPDQIVYCKPYPLYIEDEKTIPEKVEEYKTQNGFLPKLILVKDCGAYAVDVSEKGSENASMLFNDALKIACYAESFGGGKPMTDELTDFIVNWEAEAYRSKQVK
ncbi:MAG: class II aldolase [Ruminococcaceae bacterium]|nr:class II aldolase [Oscillospiraceae bacterium]